MADPLRIIVSTPPAEQPVSLSDAKAYLRVDHTSDDDLITALVAAATDAAERYTGCAFVTRTYKAYLDKWPSDTSKDEWWDGVREGIMSATAKSAIDLPYPPLGAVTAVNVYGDDGTSEEWPTTNYHVDTITRPGRIALKTGGVIPLPTKTINGIEIEYSAGFGNASDVPELIKAAVKRLIAHMYENRGDEGDAAVKKSGAGQMLGQYRIVRLT
jgi:hypothetical protein